MWSLESADDFTGYGYDDDFSNASDSFERCDNCSCEMGRHKFEVCETCHYKRCLRCSNRERGKDMMFCQLCGSSCCKDCEVGCYCDERCPACQGITRCTKCVANREVPIGYCENCGHGRKDQKDHHNTAGPLEITSVQLYDSHKRAIDFENDEGTKSKLLRAIGGFLAARVKEDVEVKEEPNEAEANVEVKEEPNEAEPNVEVREEHTEAEPPEEERRRGRRSQRSRKRFNAMRQRALSPGSD